MDLESNKQEFDYVRKFYGGLQAAIGTDEDGDTVLYNNYFPGVFLRLYNEIFEYLPFSREHFDKHERLQEIITEFELDKEAFWNLVVYLYDYTSDACQNMLVEQPSSQDIIEEIARLTDGTKKLTSITIETENKEKITITDPVILKHIEFEFDYVKLSPIELSTFTSRPLKEIDKTDARRKTSYFYAKQLVDFFGLEGFDKIKRRQGASVSNKEKELILSLLYVCKFMDNPESYLDTGYFNKLMKDYSGSKMNMSHRYEFTIPSY